jgi:hypothetical protein
LDAASFAGKCGFFKTFFQAFNGWCELVDQTGARGPVHDTVPVKLASVVSMRPAIASVGLIVRLVSLDVVKINKTLNGYR